MDVSKRIAEQEADLLYMIEDYARSGALEEDKEFLEMANQSEQVRPYLGQRCHVEEKGFGTIVKINELRNNYGEPVIRIRVELDAQVSRWYEVKQVELLPTYPAC